MKLFNYALLAILALSWFARSAYAGDSQAVVITIENHHFTPSEVHIPADKPAVLLIKNLDASAEEFESGALKLEKVIAAKGEGTVHVRPLKHGHYTFVGEYHEKEARGVLIAD